MQSNLAPLCVSGHQPPPSATLPASPPWRTSASASRPGSAVSDLGSALRGSHREGSMGDLLFMCDALPFVSLPLAILPAEWLAEPKPVEVAAPSDSPISPFCPHVVVVLLCPLRLGLFFCPNHLVWLRSGEGRRKSARPNEDGRAGGDMMCRAGLLPFWLPGPQKEAAAAPHQHGGMSCWLAPGWDVGRGRRQHTPHHVRHRGPRASRGRGSGWLPSQPLNSPMGCTKICFQI